MATLKRNRSLRVELTQDIERTRSAWISWALGGPDLAGCISYWARVKWDDDHDTWIVTERDGDGKARKVDRRFLERAWLRMAIDRGFGWSNSFKCDATTYDQAIQLEMFDGVCRYG